MNRDLKEVNITKNGITHVLRVDKEGNPVDKKGDPIDKEDVINPQKESEIILKKKEGELSYYLAIISVVLYIIPCTSIFAIIGAPLALILGMIGLKQEKTSYPEQKSKSKAGITISLVLIIIMIIDISLRVYASLLKY